MKISVIVCTYNREKYLAECLEHLSVQSFDKSQFEILLIDNNSSDSTREIVKKCIELYNNIQIKYIFEKKAGLSNARNRGILESRGDLVIFIDDDAYASPNWLETIYGTFQKFDADCVGGKIDLIYEIEKPHWLSEKLELLLTKIDWGNTIREIDFPREWIAGANMAFKKNIFNTKLFDPSLGRIGASLLSGEEIEIMKFIKDTGGKIIYNPLATVNHIVPKERIELDFFFERNYSGGKSAVIMDSRKGIYNNINSLISILIQATKLFLTYLLKRDLTKKVELYFYFGMLRGLINKVIYK